MVYIALGQQLVIVSENKTGFFNTLAGFFSRGRSFFFPCCLNDLLVNFREESSRIGRF